MLDSRAWRAARPARTSAREEAFRIEGPGSESELILLLLLLVLLVLSLLDLLLLLLMLLI